VTETILSCACCKRTVISLKEAEGKRKGKGGEGRREKEIEGPAPPNYLA